MTTIHQWLLSTLLICVATGAVAQQKPGTRTVSDSKPSLNATLALIQKKQNAQGLLSADFHVSDSSSNSNFEVTETWSNHLIPDASTCRITNQHTDQAVKNRAGGSSPLNSQSYVLDLRAVTKVSVMTWAQAATEDNASQGLAYITMLDSDPVFFAAKIYKKNDKPTEYIFRDIDTANQVAKAVVHAVELCGGGGDDDPAQAANVNEPDPRAAAQAQLDAQRASDQLAQAQANQQRVAACNAGCDTAQTQCNQAAASQLGTTLGSIIGNTISHNFAAAQQSAAEIGDPNACQQQFDQCTSTCQ
ncbi:hypothetical protein [Pararobbsia silviterrae]|uniref:Uncharacterized protein n=1 Tax=Pararobbsia silviterrae TaxID=1792498 RepID=A0A494XF92_9BURK|nr:hypothetical protein [Pararobbsia silviterrae]RKP47156.1 hypothetical protein D7S86_23750 [Pararobbsia silviterrae]